MAEMKDRRAELLSRIREDTQKIAALADGGTNVPLEDYIDKVSLTALCDALALDDPNGWQVDDLERILVIRDGLYEQRSKLRDLGDDKEHSVDQIISALDRLYTDLDGALREINQDDLKKAQAEVAALQRGLNISSTLVPGTTNEMKAEASEVLVRAHTSIQHIEINLLKIDRTNVNFEILQNMRLSVQRLSASVFAIKLSLEQGIVYQGIFKLLSDGADRIVDELRKLLLQVKASYETAEEFIAELRTLAEKGTRFARLVAQFLNKAFAQSDETLKAFTTLRVHLGHQGEAILSATRETDSRAIIAGRNGGAWTVDTASNRFQPRYRLSTGPVYSVAYITKDLIAVGTDDGVECGSAHSGIHEQVTAIAIAPWGAKGSYGAIISGSRNGFVRRLTLAGGLSLASKEAYEQIGRRVNCLVVHGDEVIAASPIELVRLDQDMRTTRTIKTPFEVTGMTVMSKDTIVVCGQGNIAHVNLDSGFYTRMITASDTAKYACVVANGPETFYFGTEEGRCGLMQLASGEELGTIDVGFLVRGIVTQGSKFLAYGGEWSSRGRCAAIVGVETVKKPIEKMLAR
jgi:hypothetical protein